MRKCYKVTTSLLSEGKRAILRIIDPEGVERRGKHRLKRRRYTSKGQNDGMRYDKLNPFGFCVHDCIDGAFCGWKYDLRTTIPLWWLSFTLIV